MKYPKAIEELIGHLTSLPGVGPKTAERYVFHLLNLPNESLQKMAQSIAELKEKIIICKKCLRVAEQNPCSVCSDKKRNKKLICVVSNTRDLISLESTGTYNGVYHVLGGVIDPIKNITHEQLTVKQLIKNISDSIAEEIILALNPTMEGETTTLYLTKLLKKNFPQLKITRLAKGLPMGADLEYADEITLSNALKYRNKV